MAKPRVFVFAADEPIGFEIVYDLLKSKKFKDEADTVYAGILNNAKKYELQKLGAEVVKYDKHDLYDTKQYLEKSDIAVLIVHSIENAFVTAGLMIEFVAVANVPSSILISQASVDQSSPLSPLRKYLDLEGKFKSFDFKGAIIRYGFLTDNLLHVSKVVRNENKLKLYLGNGIISPISKKDVSFAVASYLIKQYKKQSLLIKYDTIILTGCKEYDGNGIALSISKGTNEIVVYEDISRAEMDELLEARGLSSKHREYVLDIFQIAKDGNFKLITNYYEKLTGEKPKGVEYFIKDNISNFKPDSFCNIL